MNYFANAQGRELRAGNSTAAASCGFVNHNHRLSILRPRHHRATRLDNARFLARNLGRGVAQQVRMIKPNTRNNRNLGHINHVRRVQTTAKANLEHHDVALAFRKILQRNSRHQLELCGMVVAFSSHRLGMLANLKRNARKRLVADIEPIHANALFKSFDKGTGKQARGIASSLQYTRNIRTRAALPIRARNVHEPKRILRAPQTLKKLSNTVEPQPRGLPIGSVDIRNGIEISRFK